MSHIDGGVKIISEIQLSPNQKASKTSDLAISTVPYISLSKLNLIFIRLDTQASTIVPRRKRQLLSSKLDDHHAGYQKGIPRTFSSFEEARNSLAYIHTANARGVPPIRPTIPSDPMALAKIEVTLQLRRSVTALNMKLWDDALQSFIAHHASKMDKAIKKAVLLLKLHKILISISSKIDSLKAMHDETAWDDFMSDYEAIVVLSSEFLASVNTSAAKNIAFNFDGGVIHPLSLVAIKCRDYHIRRRAIELLRSQERVEGIFNSIVTARAVERLVEIEEEGLRFGTGVREMWKAENIPRERRIAMVEINFSTASRKAHLVYQKYVPVEDGRGIETRPVVVVDEWLEW